MKTNFGVMSSSMHLIPMREGSQLTRVKGKWKLLGDQQPRATGMFREAHFIETIFEPQDLAMYRTLLPGVLNMPAVPKVKMGVVKQGDVVYPLGPYKLGFIYLLGEYEGVQRWHVLAMPEDAWVPVKHGNGWGYPKYVVDKIEFEQTSKGFYGAVEDRGEKLFSLNFSEDSSQASLFERITSTSPLIFLRNMLADEEIPVITFSPYSLDVPTENKAVLETKQLILGVPSELSDKFGWVSIGVGSNFPWKPLLPENKIIPGRVGYFKGELNLNRTMLRAPLGEKIGRTSIIDMVGE
jgi:hypothetical protein